jgi:hypothetical protein
MTTPPDFTSGAILTAAQMNGIGLWLVKTQTIGSAVSSQAVTGAFSADYEAYKIIISGGVGSTSADLQLTLGATAAGYYAGYSRTDYPSAAAALASNNGASSWTRAGSGSTDTLFANFDLINPFLTKRTIINGFNAFQVTTLSGGAFGGFLDNATSYTGFTVTASTGTMTGGTIRVYGYRL